MQITIVGSGTVVPHPERVCASYYVEMDDSRILLDCGPGAMHHMARFDLSWDCLTHVILSHFHTDHIGDLPILLFALKYGVATPRKDPLTIVGPEGTRLLLERLAAAFGDYMLDPGFPLGITEVTAGTIVRLGGTARILCHPTPHTEHSLAYRIESGAKVLGYTGDTGLSEELGRFFQGVDLLIAECSLPDELAMDTHLTPTRVAAIARIAEPDRLILTHVYPQLPAAELPRLVRQAGWTGSIVIAEDGMRLTVDDAPPL